MGGINSLRTSSSNTVSQELRKRFGVATSRLCPAGGLVTLPDLPITAAIVEQGARQLPSERSLCGVDGFDASVGLTSGLGGFSAWGASGGALPHSAKLRQTASASTSAVSAATCHLTHPHLVEACTEPWPTTVDQHPERHVPPISCRGAGGLRLCQLDLSPQSWTQRCLRLKCCQCRPGQRKPQLLFRETMTPVLKTFWPIRMKHLKKQSWEAVA